MSIVTGSDLNAGSAPVQLLGPLRNRIRCIARSGLSPRALLLTVCIGVAVGLLPLVWGASLLCLLLAHLFRLNHLVLQSVNYLLYPLQLALLIPFCKLGLAWFPWGPALPADRLASLLHDQSADRLTLFFWLSIKAVGAWLLTVPPLVILIYLALLFTLVKRYEKAPVPAPTAPVV